MRSEEVPNVPVLALPPAWQSNENVMPDIVTAGLPTAFLEPSKMLVDKDPALIVWLKVEFPAALAGNAIADTANMANTNNLRNFFNITAPILALVLIICTNISISSICAATLVVFFALRLAKLTYNPIQGGLLKWTKIQKPSGFTARVPTRKWRVYAVA
jgi:hypothetical protein